MFYKKLQARNIIEHCNIVNRGCSPNGFKGLSGNTSTSAGPVASACSRQTEIALSHRKKSQARNDNKRGNVLAGKEIHLKIETNKQKLLHQSKWNRKHR